jgi:hypothetical protein
MVVVIIHQAQTNLVQMVLALHPPRGLTSHLHCGQQQTGEHADHAKSDKQFDQGRCPALHSIQAQPLRGPPQGSCLHRSFLLQDSPIQPLGVAPTEAPCLNRGSEAPTAIDPKRRNIRRPSREDVE